MTYRHTNHNLNQTARERHPRNRYETVSKTDGHKATYKSPFLAQATSGLTKIFSDIKYMICKSAVYKGISQHQKGFPNREQRYVSGTTMASSGGGAAAAAWFGSAFASFSS